MTTLVTAWETLDERVDRLVCSRSDAWPPLHSTPSQTVIAELIVRTDGLEDAVRALALEVQRLMAENDRLEAHTSNEH
jgi:hypothetical protein